MKQCPKCGKEHNKNGQFCSRQCANSRNFSQESKDKKSASASAYFDKFTKEERKKGPLDDEKLKRFRKKIQKTIENKMKDVPFDKLGIGKKKERIIKEQEGRCNGCSLKEWMGKPIPLELEHKDGNNQNNIRDNLEVLCPNCHAQTSTYKGRNTKITHTDEQIIEALKINSSAYQTLRSLGMSTHGKHYNRLRKIIKQYQVQLNYTV